MVGGLLAMKRRWTETVCWAKPLAEVDHVTTRVPSYDLGFVTRTFMSIRAASGGLHARIYLSQIGSLSLPSLVSYYRRAAA